MDKELVSNLDVYKELLGQALNSIQSGELENAREYAMKVRVHSEGDLSTLKANGGFKVPLYTTSFFFASRSYLTYIDILEEKIYAAEELGHLVKEIVESIQNTLDTRLVASLFFPLNLFVKYRRLYTDVNYYFGLLQNINNILSALEFREPELQEGVKRYLRDVVLLIEEEHIFHGKEGPTICGVLLVLSKMKNQSDLKASIVNLVLEYLNSLHETYRELVHAEKFSESVLVGESLRIGVEAVKDYEGTENNIAWLAKVNYEMWGPLLQLGRINESFSALVQVFRLNEELFFEYKSNVAAQNILMINDELIMPMRAHMKQHDLLEQLEEIDVIVEAIQNEISS